MTQETYWKIKPQWTFGSKSQFIRLTIDACFTHKEKDYWIPQCYECDGASIPKFAWYIVGTPTEGDNIFAAFAHDPLYLSHALPRKESDIVARNLWLQTDKPKYQVAMIYRTLRIAGYPAWVNSTNDKLDLAIMCNLIKQRPIEEQEKFKTLWPI